MEPDHDLTSAACDVVVEGTVVRDADRGPSGDFTVSLFAPSTSRMGGALMFVVQQGAFTLTGERLSWAAVTRRGWAHLRGEGHLADGSRAPFRCDVYSAAAANSTGKDLISVRIYPPDSDPDRDSPAFKLTGTMPRGTVRLRTTA